MNSYWKRLWTEINLDNLLCNFNVIKQRLGDSTKICCVVKANAYGHHAPKIASVLENAGADMFGVSNIEEALQLRNAAIKAPILILGYTPPECAYVLAENNITQCVYSLEYARCLSENLSEHNRSINVHIKIDTGMGRLGFQCDEKSGAVSQILDVSKLAGLNIEGIFTHFAVSDNGEKGKSFTNKQYNKFTEIVTELENKGLTFKCKHCSNSAAAIMYPEFSMDMVRAGLILYGLLPSDEVLLDVELKPVMSLKSVVSNIKTINKGDTVSYGCDFVATEKMKIATVPMGYADGFFRSNTKNNVSLIVKGKKAPIIGRICMDQLMLDVSSVDGLEIGDEVVVFGDEQGVNSADDFAKANGTINYEIICSVGKRVPRVFALNDEIESVHLGLLNTFIN